MIEEKIGEDLAKIADLFENLLKPAVDLRNSIAPEMEYVASGVMLYFVLSIMLKHGIFSENMSGAGLVVTNQMADALSQFIDTKTSVSSEAVYGAVAGTYALFVIDGARRITKERLPQILAWFRVFVLHNSSE